MTWKPSSLPFLALIKPVAVPIHFQYIHMMGEPIKQRSGQALRAEHLRPLVKWQIAGHQYGASLIALAEDFEQQLCAGLG